MKKISSVRSIAAFLGTLAIAIAAFCVSAPRVHAQGPAAAPPAPAPTAADMKGKTADQFYKKIEVLKGIPAEQVHPAMEYITTALGVGCGYCHVIGHFDQDDKREKHVARSMIQMTMALNNTVFDGKRELTCYTCHRGVAKASTTLLLAGDLEVVDDLVNDLVPGRQRRRERANRCDQRGDVGALALEYLDDVAGQPVDIPRRQRLEQRLEAVEQYGQVERGRGPGLRDGPARRERPVETPISCRTSTDGVS